MSYEVIVAGGGPAGAAAALVLARAGRRVLLVDNGTAALGARPDRGVGSGARAGSRTGNGARAGAGSGTSFGTEPRSRSESGFGSGTESRSGSGSGTEPRSRSESGTGSGSGTESRSGSGSGTGSGAGSVSLSVPFRIGETLPPAARPLLHDLGLWPGFVAAPHLRCVGTYASWGSEALHGHSHLHDPQGHGWHLDRARFDAFLRGAAEAAGAEPRRAEVVPLPLRGGVPRVLIRAGGRVAEERCDWLVDATGRRAVIGRRHGRRHKQDRLVAVYALFERRLPGQRAEDAELRSLVEAVPRGWWYTARVPAGRVVAHLTDADLADSALRSAGGFLDAIGRTRHVRTRLDGYDPAAAPAPRWTSAHGLRLHPAAGPGWIAAGDAALAVDPLSSQGILNALHTGARAGLTVERCLSGEPAALAEYCLFLERIAGAYARHHAETYGQEQRWPGHTFWERRRHAPLVPHRSGT